jgi:hypothetical protein
MRQEWSLELVCGVEQILPTALMKGQSIFKATAMVLDGIGGTPMQTEAQRWSMCIGDRTTVGLEANSSIGIIPPVVATESPVNYSQQTFSTLEGLGLYKERNLEDKIIMIIKKADQVLMEHELSRFSLNEGNLSLGLKSVQMFDIPMLFQGVYEVTVITPTQTITKTAVYISYNYMVFSNTIKDEVTGEEKTYLDCSDNGLLFRVIG